MEARPTAPLMPISPPPYPARPGPLRGPTDLTYTGLLMEVRVGEGLGGEGPGEAGFVFRDGARAGATRALSPPSEARQAAKLPTRPDPRRRSLGPLPGRAPRADRASGMC